MPRTIIGLPIDHAALGREAGADTPATAVPDTHVDAVAAARAHADDYADDHADVHAHGSLSPA